jgi:hypothetical protein
MAMFSFVYYHSFIKVRLSRVLQMHVLMFACVHACMQAAGSPPTFTYPYLQLYNVNGILETIFAMQPEAQDEIYQHLTSYLKATGRLS